MGKKEVPAKEPLDLFYKYVIATGVYVDGLSITDDISLAKVRDSYGNIIELEYDNNLEVWRTVNSYNPSPSSKGPLASFYSYVKETGAHINMLNLTGATGTAEVRDDTGEIVTLEYNPELEAWE